MIGAFFIIISNFQRSIIMKKTLIILVSIATLFGLFMLSFIFLSKHIFNYVSCEQFNIDNIELRTGIDVPKVQKENILCSCTDTTKTSSFMIDLEKVELDSYLDRNGFVLADKLYKKSNKNEFTDWVAEYDPKENILSFDLKYYRNKD